MKQLYELHGQGVSIRGIAKQLGIGRNTVRTYLRAEELPKARTRGARGSKLDPYKSYIDQRLSEGVSNCVVLYRELESRGYAGGISTLRDYVHPLRPPRQPAATCRFETSPGQQAQVDFGRFRYRRIDGSSHYVWAFVLVLSWSRALYLEFVRRADVATFIRCHVHAFEYLGGMPQQCLYDNAKVVVLGRDAANQPVWNPQFLDFSLRVGVGIQLCRPYRPQTKGRVESGIKYIRGNFWPGARFCDDADLNQQALAWCDAVANVRVHGTTYERPIDRLEQERGRLLAPPPGDRVLPFLRERRKVGRDGFVQWERACYGVPWHWVGQEVEVASTSSGVEIWHGTQRLAVHPLALRAGQRFILPGQWTGLPTGSSRPPTEPIALEVPSVEVQQRPLMVYQDVLTEGV